MEIAHVLLIDAFSSMVEFIHQQFANVRWYGAVNPDGLANAIVRCCNLGRV